MTGSQQLLAMLEVGPDLCAILLVPLQDEEETRLDPTLKAELLPHSSPISLGVTCSIEGFGEVIGQYRWEEGQSSQRHPHPHHETTGCLSQFDLQIQGYLQ